MDASREAVLAAELHARGDESLASLLRYRHGTVESLEAQGRNVLLIPRISLLAKIRVFESAGSISQDLLMHYITLTEKQAY